MDVTKPNRMLVVLAHPDDESFAVGGTLAKYAHEGVEIVLLCATRGEAGILGKSSEEAGKIREHELLEAAKHLGAEVFFLGYMDGELSQVPATRLMESIGCWIDTVQPQVILTFGPDGISGHPDHITISNIVTQTVYKFFPDICLLYVAASEATVLGCGVSSTNLNSGEIRVAVDISEYKTEKLRAIQSHASQNPALDGKPEVTIDQITCFEYFTVAPAGSCSNANSNWFENLQDLTGELVR